MSDDSHDSSSSSSSSDYGFDDAGSYDAGSGNDWDHSHGSHHSHHHHRRFRHGRKRRGYLDLSTAQPWVKVLTWVGTLTLIAGVLIIGLGIIDSASGVSGGGATAGSHPLPGGGIAGDPFPGGGIPGEAFPGEAFPGEAFPGGIPENERLITVDGHVVDLESGTIVDPGASSSRAAGPVEETNYIGLGVGLFVVGLLLSAVAALGHSTSRKR
jgi:hypothetical protein